MPKFSANKLIGKASEFAGHLFGTTAKGKAVNLDVLSNTRNVHGQPLPKEFITRAKRELHVANGRKFQARVKTGVGLATVGTAGALATRAYQKHEDNKILRQLDSMYGSY